MTAAGIAYLPYKLITPYTNLPFHSTEVSPSSVPFSVSKYSELSAECLHHKWGTTPAHRYLSFWTWYCCIVCFHFIHSSEWEFVLFCGLIFFILLLTNATEHILCFNLKLEGLYYKIIFKIFTLCYQFFSHFYKLWFWYIHSKDDK